MALDSDTVDRLDHLLDTYLPELARNKTRLRDVDRQIRAHVRSRVAAKVAEIEASGQYHALALEEFPAPPPYEPQRDQHGVFADYFEHWARVWAADLAPSLAGSPIMATENTVVSDFLRDQAVVVGDLMIRTLLGELHKRRASAALAGDTPEERYRDFRRWLHSPEGHAAFVGRYPALFEHARARVRMTVAYLLEVVSAVERNQEQVAGELLGLRECPPVTAIFLGAGDTHNDGRSTAFIEFGDAGSVIYKPHPLDAEAGYNALVAWVNRRLGTRLPTVKVLTCGDAGFVERVATEEYEGSDSEYAAQIGQLAGVLYILRAIDIHFENVVTCRRGPVVVDTETLMTPDVRTGYAGPHDDSAAAVGSVFYESVAKIGILPMVIKTSTADHGLDIGAVGYDKGQQALVSTWRIRNPGRDDMFVELHKPVMRAENANQTVGQSGGSSVRAQRDVIKRELARVLRFAAANRTEVMDAVERHLGKVQFRYLNNPTYFYLQLLRMVTHPDAVRDATIREAVLRRTALRPGALDPVVDDEVRQLANGDVPYFSYYPDSCALWAHGGRIVCEDAFKVPPIESVRERISRLDEETIDRELRMVDLAFVNKLPMEKARTGFRAVSQDAPVALPNERMLAEVVRIADRLVAEMVVSADEDFPSTWIGPQIVVSNEDSLWAPGPLAFDLYSGAGGTALALAGAAHATGDRRYRDAALRVFGPIDAGLCAGDLMDEMELTGGQGAFAGTVYALAVAKKLLAVDGGMTPGKLAAELARRADGERGSDWVTGLAGTLAICMALHGMATDPDDRALAEKAVRMVAAAEVALLGGVELADPRVTDYTGYSHGAMGIGPALVAYGTRYHDPAVRELGLRIIDAALGALDPRDRDWPTTWADLNERTYAWCHGAPGMLVGAVWAARYAPQAVPADLLHRMFEITLERGFGANPTYCHGDLGSAEALTLAGADRPDLFGDRRLDSLYPRLFAEVVERYDEKNPESKYRYSNSLMLGQAGLLWSILRYLDPDTYPSVLLID